MVTITDWILLWLVVVKFSKAPQSFIDDTPVEKHTQSDLIRVTVDHFDRVSQEPFRSKRFRTDGQEAVSTHWHEENLASPERTLSEERRAEIKQNLARYQETLSAMKDRGVAMGNLFRIVIQREEMLRQYSFVIEGESISFIMRKLKGVQQDINTVVQTRLRRWAGLGGMTFNPVKQDEISAQLPQEPFHEPPGAPVSNLKVQYQTHKSPIMISQNLSTEPVVEGRPAKGQKFTEETVPMNDSKSTKKVVGGQEESKPQLNVNFIEIVHEKLMESAFEDLSHILHSVTFKSWTNPYWATRREEIRVIRLAFEKSILQAIHFMYKFELVKEGKFQQFLASYQTLDIIGNHLIGIFNVVRDEVYNSLAFIPDMGFLGKHWRTAHLHEILKVLGRDQQAQVLSAALSTNVELYGEFVVRIYHERWPYFIKELILKENFLDRLNRMKPGRLNNSDSGSFEKSDLTIWGKEIVTIFQEPNPNFGQHHLIDEAGREEIERNKIGYILIYHIIRFMKKYHEGFLIELFGEERKIDYEILNKQLEILRQGLKLHQILSQGQTYKEIIQFPKVTKYHITNKDAYTELHSAQRIYAKLSEDYKKLEKDFKEIYRLNWSATNWIQSDYFISKIILSDFNSIAINWNIGIRSEMERRWNLRGQSKKGYQLFPNLSFKYGALLSARKNPSQPNREILELWDPHGIYM